MENLTLETLLVAQVLTLAKMIEIKAAEDKSKTSFGVNYEREAIKLIRARSPDVLRLLSETKAP